MNFDTHRSVKTLINGGFTDAQSESLVEVLSNFVTKKELQDDLNKLELKLVIKLGSMMVMAIGTVAVLVKLL